MNRLDRKVAFVTGGAKGIGRAAVELFAEEGADVVTGDLETPEPFTSDRITAHEMDVSKEEDWSRVIAATMSAHGRVDILFNNAGLVGAYEPLDEIALEDWHRIVAINQTGTFLGMRAVIPTMRDNGGGAIVNVSSIWGIVGAPGVSAYQASKGAVRLMTKNAAASYADVGIRVNSVHPGVIDTPMVQAQDPERTQSLADATPLKRVGRPREVAHAALFLASDDASYITGAELVVDGGYTAI